jgi:hypothetical protein
LLVEVAAAVPGRGAADHEAMNTMTRSKTTATMTRRRRRTDHTTML